MEPLEHVPDMESRRMELRGVVRLAGEVIAQYWPMRTFVHHNPLHSIEYLPFEEAVKRGKQFLGGNGYLPVGPVTVVVLRADVKVDVLARQDADLRGEALDARRRVGRVEPGVGVRPRLGVLDLDRVRGRRDRPSRAARMGLRAHQPDGGGERGDPGRT